MSTNLTRDQSDAQRTYEEFLGRANDARNSLNDAQWAQVAAAQTAFKQVWAAGPDDARLDAADVFKKTIRAVLKGVTAPAGDQSVPPVPAPSAPAPNNSTPPQPPAPAPSPASAGNDAKPAWLDDVFKAFDDAKVEPIRKDVASLSKASDNHEERLNGQDKRLVVLEKDTETLKRNQSSNSPEWSKGALIGIVVGVIVGLLAYNVPDFHQTLPRAFMWGGVFAVITALLAAFALAKPVKTSSTDDDKSA